MKMMRALPIALAVFLLSTPAMFAQDLSKYRDFSLGTSVAGISKQVSGTSNEVAVVRQSPALIQELTWWPTRSYQPSAPSQSVQEVLFSFYNGQLYKMVVTYEGAATQGLTSADMVRALSAIYGAATMPVAKKSPTAMGAFSDTEEAVAFWEDSHDSVTLSRSPLSNVFQLVLFSKQANAQANTAIAEAVAQEREDAPQIEAARVKKEADELEALRQTNLKAFRP